MKNAQVHSWLIGLFVSIGLVGLCISVPAGARNGDYAFSFRARSAPDADQVQIWASFRVADRFDRYWVGIKGGLQDDVYLMRQGYMGTDALMGVRPLDFHPLPGQWYRVRVEACGPRIRVFVGDNPLPYMDVTDPDWKLASAGPVELGGGWIETEYADLKVEPLPENEYDLLLATREWAGQAGNDATVIDASCTAGPAELRRRIEEGENMVFLNCKELAREVFPEYITGWIIPTEGDIAFMERPEDPVFDGIGPLELRYFNDDHRGIPLVCTASLKTVRCPQVLELAGQMKIHAYIEGGTQEDRLRRIDAMRGFPLVEISVGKGHALVSTLCTDKAGTDPVAGRLLNNMLNYYQ